jgi:hypothetical protein
VVKNSHIIAGHYKIKTERAINYFYVVGNEFLSINDMTFRLQ